MATKKKAASKKSAIKDKPKTVENSQKGVIKAPVNENPDSKEKMNSQTNVYIPSLGDIIGNRRFGSNVNHHFACLGQNKNGLTGVMLTHHDGDGNIPLMHIHIKIEDKNGIKFIFQFDDTYIVAARFIKKEEWGPYSKIGELTTEGVQFIKDQVDNSPLDYYFNFPSFKKRLRRKK